MRVLFAQTTPYLPDEFGGALASTDALCRRLLRRGIRVEVLALARPSLFDGLFSRTRWSSSYPVHRANDPLNAARAICQSRRPDIAVVQLGDLGGLADAFAGAGVPVLIYGHDRFTFDQAVLPDHALISYAACSAFLVGHMRRRLGVEVAFVPVLVEPDDYRVESTRRVVTFVNPIPRKGSDIVFALAARRPDIPFVFVEAWVLRNRVWRYLDGRAAHYGNVRLMRRTDDMRPVYASSRIILAPSLGDEAWGRVVSEAQVSGLPAITSNSGGLPEAVGPGGIVVDRDASIEDWGDALSQLWDNPDVYRHFAQKASEHARRTDFQPDQVVDAAIRVLSLRYT
jgi:glycosyltransferase involved in cell wall biosynthesis